MLATDSVTGAGIPMALARCVMLPADAVSPAKSTFDLVDEGLRFAFQVPFFFVYKFMQLFCSGYLFYLGCFFCAVHPEQPDPLESLPGPIQVDFQ